MQAPALCCVFTKALLAKAGRSCNRRQIACRVPSGDASKPPTLILQAVAQRTRSDAFPMLPGALCRSRRCLAQQSTRHPGPRIFSAVAHKRSK
jgi:hypothetical protein